MATLITEVYISVDGENFTKLNLHKDESIPMQYTTKDLQDLTKIFSPYSLSFTFPADSRNRAAFGFFGDTDVIKINPDNKFKTKIYTDGNINLQGFIQLEALAYKNAVPTDFTGSFSTSMTNLAARLGDDLIEDLPEESISIDWKPDNVYSLLTSARSTTIDGVPLKYFVPLISSTRVLAYSQDQESSLKDNVAYNAFIDADSDKTIKADELRPCISFSTVIELIKKKYNLDVVAPLDLRKEYTEAVIWCNSETMFNPVDSLLTVKNPFGSLKKRDTRDEGDIPDPKKYTPSVDLTDSSFKILSRNPPTNDDKYYTQYCNIRARLNNVIITDQSDSPTATVKIIRKGTDEILASKKFDILEYDMGGNYFELDMQLNDELFIDYELEFFMYVQFDQPTTWQYCDYEFNFKYYDPRTGLFRSSNKATYYYESPFNYNATDVGGTNINLFSSLPKMKVVDFLTSYFKTFNISVFDTSPNDDRLYWLTPEDIKTELLPYSKATIDYTRYLNAKRFKKEVPNDFNYYDFKHATSKYRSNVDYLAAQGLEYGQVKYPLEKPTNPVAFILETGFTLMVPVLLNGSNDIVTYYGFDDEAPEILETGESRYSPNYEELTVFYNVGNTPTEDVLGFQNIFNSGGFSYFFDGTTITSPLSSYMKVLPINSENKTLAFSVLKELGIEYPESLYKRYYKAQTERLLDPNVLSQAFELELPPDEIYLNEATTIQGSGLTPKGFRLQNDIILREDLFSILDATIDITTGKTKITLLNY